MIKPSILSLYICLIICNLAIAKINKEGLNVIRIPICTSSEVKKAFVFKVESLDAHLSNLDNLNNSKTLKVGEMVEKLKSFSSRDLPLEISPSYSKRVLKNTKSRIVIDDEEMEISTMKLKILPNKQVYWEVVFKVHGGFGDMHFFHTVMFLDGFIPPRETMKKSREKAKGAEKHTSSHPRSRKSH